MGEIEELDKMGYYRSINKARELLIIAGKVSKRGHYAKKRFLEDNGEFFYSGQIETNEDEHKFVRLRFRDYINELKEYARI
jgi:hypothetical protein